MHWFTEIIGILNTRTICNYSLYFLHLFSSPSRDQNVPKLRNTVNTVQIPLPALAGWGHINIICTVFKVFPNLGMDFLIYGGDTLVSGRRWK